MTADLAGEDIKAATEFLRRVGLHGDLAVSAEKHCSILVLLRRHLQVERVDRGRIVCILTVHPEIVNIFNRLHGGVVAAVAEEVARACAKTVAGDKEFFVGEAESSYLSAATLDAQVQVNARILRQGRSVIVTYVEFLAKETKRLLYTHRATFYNMPASSL